MDALMALAAKIFGAPREAENYLFIFFVVGIGFSVALVALTYLFFWIFDLLRNRRRKLASPIKEEKPAAADHVDSAVPATSELTKPAR